VNNGRIENSIAWRTGMQDTETIGTPNAIWTWMCRNCTVRHSEAFLTDSPGVDGGAFDIDYGNDDNLVEENYAHDTQGYCVAVFAAGWVTSNSVVRNNICASNGLSPRLARRQGAIFLSTWNDGKIRDVEISDNRIFWDPPLATPAIVNVAQVEGKAAFERNTIRSEPAAMAGSKPGKWRLTALVSGSDEDHDSRGEVAMLESIHAQFPEIQVKIIVDGQSILNAVDRENLPYDWNTRDIPVSFDDTNEGYPVMALVDPSGKPVWRREGLAPPGELGLLLQSCVGHPEYAKMQADR
jgi:hypothetical protein